MGRGVGLGIVVWIALAALASPASGARVCAEELVPMDDGVRLHAWVSRASADARRPVLLMIDSYARTARPGGPPVSDGACPEVLPDDYVPLFVSKEVVQRFTLVQVSLRGTGASEGTYDLLGPRSQRDVRAVVAWARGAPGSDGAVTLVGESGTGFAAFHALREPGVRAALLMSTCADLFGCFHRGGAPNGLSSVYLAGTSAGLRGADIVGRRAALDALGATIAAHPTDDAYWRDRSALASLRLVRVPVMYTSDLYDIVSPFDAVARTPGARLVLGMGHAAPALATAGGARYRTLVRARVDRFLARYGLGERNGAEKDPRVTVLTNLGSKAGYDRGRVLVRGAASWPPPGVRSTTLPLPALGTRALLAPVDDLRTTAWLSAKTPAPPTGAFEWTSKPLRADLEVTGEPTLRLRARVALATKRAGPVRATTAPPTDPTGSHRATVPGAGDAIDWVVRLSDVGPSGRAEWITDGRLRTTRASATVQLVGTSNVVRAGHRLRLSIAPVGPPGTATIDGATLTLPVAPHGCDRATPLVAAGRAPRCAPSLPGKDRR